MIVTLVTFSPKGVRKEIPVGDKPLVIGRGTDADVRIPLDEISRTHCEITRTGGKVIVKDLASRNGTFVNDQKIAQATVKPGDHIRAGSIVFTVQIDGQPKEILPVAAKPAAPANGSGGKPAPASGAVQTSGKTAKPSAASAPAPAGKPATDDEESFDVDGLEELDADDLSDIDIDELVEVDSDDLEEVDQVVDLSDDDLIADDDDETANGR